MSQRAPGGGSEPTGLALPWGSTLLPGRQRVRQPRPLQTDLRLVLLRLVVLGEEGRVAYGELVQVLHGLPHTPGGHKTQHADADEPLKSCVDETELVFSFSMR